jgi:hypothetical protein
MCLLWHSRQGVRLIDGATRKACAKVRSFLLLVSKPYPNPTQYISQKPHPTTRFGILVTLAILTSRTSRW